MASRYWMETYNIDIEHAQLIRKLGEMTGLARSAIVRDAVGFYFANLFDHARISTELHRMVNEGLLEVIDPDAENPKFRLSAKGRRELL